MIRSLSAEELRTCSSDSSRGFGALDTLHGCLPLVSLDVTVWIEGLIAETRVKQRFANRFGEPLEATYIFPLPPMSAVTGFRMTVGDRGIEGRIDERGQARAEYDRALAAGQTAAITEEERPNVFSLRVGNIPPGATADIEFALVEAVAVDEGEATYRFPLVVKPRYCPGEPLAGADVGSGITADTDQVPDASRISPPIRLPGFPDPVQFSLAVTLPFTGRLAGTFGCSLPAVAEETAPGLWQVRVSPDQSLDRDLLLRWRVADERLPQTQLWLEPDEGRPQGLGRGGRPESVDGDGCFSLVVVPPLGGNEPTPPRDVVILLDRSGSMGGWQLAAARRAVARIVDSLTAADRVCVLAFDDRLESSGGGWRPACLAPVTSEYRGELTEWLSRVRARGGTELAQAITRGLEVLRSSSAKKQPRDQSVVLITDGQVGNEAAVLRQLSRQLGAARFYAVGIDQAVNDGLLGRLANQTGGLCELVESEDRLDLAIERIRQRIGCVCVSGLTLTAEGIDLLRETVTPARLPDLVAGLPLVIRGRYRGTITAHRATALTVAGRDSQARAWTSRGEAVATRVSGHGSLWARSFLRQLEDRYELTTRRAELDPLRRTITALSQDFGVLCRFTALIAVDPQRAEEMPRQQPLRRVVQPVAGGTFADDLDLESLTPGSVTAEPARLVEGSGMLIDSRTADTDIGSAVSGGSSCLLEGGLDFTGDEVRPWDVDLGEFMNDVEEDADAPTMLGGPGCFDLDAASAEARGLKRLSPLSDADRLPRLLRSRSNQADQPLALARNLARLLEFLRPRRGQEPKLSWWRLRLFVIRLWRAARKAARAGADPAEVERLVLAASRLDAHPGNQSVVVESLDQLADLAESAQPVTRWWHFRGRNDGRAARFWD